MERVIVVAAAILDYCGTMPAVLAGRRPSTGALAGWWELPGGKVESGEDELAALVRECREELGVRITPQDRLGADLSILDGHGTLRAWTASLKAGTPRPLEHAALRWLARSELYDVAWLPGDLLLISELEVLLRS